jgi:hypothetical protein
MCVHTLDCSLFRGWTFSKSFKRIYKISHQIGGMSGGDNEPILDSSYKQKYFAWSNKCSTKPHKNIDSWDEKLQPYILFHSIYRKLSQSNVDSKTIPKKEKTLVIINSIWVSG